MTALTEEQRKSAYRQLVGERRFPVMGRTYDDVEQEALAHVVERFASAARRDLIEEMEQQVIEDTWIPVSETTSVDVSHIVRTFLRSFLPADPDPSDAGGQS